MVVFGCFSPNSVDTLGVLTVGVKQVCLDTLDRCFVLTEIRSADADSKLCSEAPGPENHSTGP